ncbi:uncharacterized protein K452DRAFT_242476 [Aplosporella prunicola CBS 121167]|uniref:rRNA biogenesis protein RRP36 n=1 Tax=Aplosporella prunicola CBS 121167 TaxID=1176127 RepID=A0A6A6BPL4_9PEZI|nr:uncharacterized protein K452DRAFT_242476 [Aplosporella prunicola CBS 121167]KAF2146016.1 hypothetical protein K452DRAFT_242476 [Aplosporella prunicola CBS 121167]
MVLSRTLGRSLRAREDDDDSEPYSDELEGSSPSVLATGEGGDIGTPDPESASEDDEMEVFQGEEEEDNGDEVKEQLSKVSFGALAKAQDALSKQNTATKKRKRGSDNTADQEDKLQALRERLRELKKTKQSGDGAARKSSAKKSKAAAKEESAGEETSASEPESDSEDEASAKPKSRSSKHAPAVQSSKKPVGRKRQILETSKRQARDPRFDALSGPVNEQKLKSNYAFLNDYRESEMAELKATIKKSKNEADKEILKKKLLSMESQKKARETKERQEKVQREHKMKEKEAVKEGKTPFYLKKSDAKKLALVDKFDSMKGKQRDKLMERRRKKVASKERKNMPAARRMAG